MARVVQLCLILHYYHIIPSKHPWAVGIHRPQWVGGGGGERLHGEVIRTYVCTENPAEPLNMWVGSYSAQFGSKLPIEIYL